MTFTDVSLHSDMLHCIKTETDAVIKIVCVLFGISGSCSIVSDR